LDADIGAEEEIEPNGLDPIRRAQPTAAPESVVRPL
jgi:hypothetical protein